jgi:SSS family solute:Na+ symporter
MTGKGAIASLMTGTCRSLIWLAFVHAKEAAPFGVSQALLGVDIILTGT